MGGLLRFWFRLDGRVSRGAYATTGFGLMALKYAVEATLVRVVAHESFSPLQYLSPFVDRGGNPFDALPVWLGFLVALWTIPFVWIGVSMSLRRALDAGWSPWLALVFFAPFLNYALMLALACVPPRPAPDVALRVAEERARPALAAALEALALSLLVALPFFYLVVNVLNEYNLALFLGLPFLIGALAARVYNRGRRRTLRGTLGVAALAILMGSGALLLFAFEGLMCVLMALPILLALGCLGAVFGRALTPRLALPGEVGLIAVCWPLWLGLEHVSFEPPGFEVVSSVEIDAPPERVWRHVIAFPPLAPPTERLFALGIAYPTGAVIEGTGVGAVRRCQFSTGDFVEPITAWEPGQRLAFDVTEQPDPMTEWSPWANVRPPHLERSFRALRGEFRLVALPGGRMRLEGSTWYALALAPVPYWRVWTDAILHSIHLRVLEHVKRLSEANDAAGASAPRD